MPGREVRGPALPAFPGATLPADCFLCCVPTFLGLLSLEPSFNYVVGEQPPLNAMSQPLHVVLRGSASNFHVESRHCQSPPVTALFIGACCTCSHRPRGAAAVSLFRGTLSLCSGGPFCLPHCVTGGSWHDQAARGEGKEWQTFFNIPRAGGGLNLLSLTLRFLL